jgi:hypothetical protein
MLQAQGAKPDIPDIPAGETYYSQLRRVIDTRHVQEKQTADDWLRYLRKPQRRVHEDELKFTGLGDLLRSKGRGRVTKTELREHLDANEIRVEEVTKGQEPGVETQKTLIDRAREYEAQAERLPHGGVPRQRLLEQSDRLWEQSRTAVQPTKFESYTLPGAENYREVLLRLPPKGGPAEFSVYNATSGKEVARYNSRAEASRHVRREPGLVLEELQGGKRQEGTFSGGHWDEPNVLAHLRLSDRTTGGKRTLLVEEVQSDWAQIIRRLLLLGESPEGRVPRAPFVEQTGKWTRLALKRVLKMAADEGYDRVGIVRGAEQAERYDLSKQVSRIRWDEKTKELRAYGLDGELVIEKTGVARSGLEEYIGKEAAAKLADQKPQRLTHDIEQTGRQEFLIRGESGYVKTPRGDEMLFQTRAAAEAYLKHQGNARELRGLDLKVGGEGMKAFYDVIVPEQLNKLAKEYGVKVQIEGGKVHGESSAGLHVSKQGRLWHIYDAEGFPHPPAHKEKFRTRSEAEAWLREQGGGVPIHTLDVPEPMKERVKKKGFPLVSGTLRDLLTRTA